MRIGIFGGSFDPVHKGHEAFVLRAISELKLDKVFVIPVSISPFKKEFPPVASGKDRIAMLKLAFEKNRRVEVLSLEVERGGLSYTVDTVRELKNKFSREEVFLLLTEESRDSFCKWKNFSELSEICNVVFLGPRTKINSTEIRKNSALCKEFLSTKVLDYIESHQLYSP